MKKSMIEIYALAVCFVCIASGGIVLGVGVYDVIQVAAPEMTLSGSQYARHQSNDNFVNFQPPWPPNGRRQQFPEDEQELSRLREESYRIEIAMERRDAGQSLVMVVIALVIQALLFVIHWKLSRRARTAA